MDERSATPTPEEESAVVDVVRRASRFSREFLATMIALVTTAFGVVVALAWNTGSRVRRFRWAAAELLA